MSELSLPSLRPGCLSDLVLDRLVAGELARTPEGTAAETHVAECARCSGRLATLRSSVENFASEVFLPGLVQQTAANVRRARLVRAGSILAGAVAMAAGILVVMRPEPPAVTAKDPVLSGERTKGGLSLTVVVKTSQGQIEEVLPGGTLSPGDAIRFVVGSDARGHIALVGIDAAPRVSAYVPDGDSAMIVEKGPPRALPGSIVLDDTLGPERLLLLRCDQPFEVARLVEAARQRLAGVGGDPRQVTAVDLPCVQTSFLIEKVKRP
jgi:hypothetical protein